MSIEEIQRIRKENERRAQEIPADYYSLANRGNLFIYTQRIRDVLEALKAENLLPLTGRKILEVGCGKGNWLSDFQLWGADPKDLSGIDLDEKRIDAARHLFPKADLRVGEASKLPWQDASFDLVFQSTLFTSILSVDLKKAVAREMMRVLKPSGVLLWYDFFYDNPRNPHVKGVSSAEIHGLFPDHKIRLSRITLAPPLARAVAPHAWILCCFLEKLKILNTHYLGVIRS